MKKKVARLEIQRKAIFVFIFVFDMPHNQMVNPKGSS